MLHTTTPQGPLQSLRSETSWSRRCRAWTIALGTLAGLGEPVAKAQSSPAQQFEFVQLAAAPATPGFVTVPTVALVPVGLASLSVDLSLQLTEAVENERATLADGARFQVQTRARGPMVRWALVASGEARAENAALAASFADLLLACLRSLGEEEAGLTALTALLAAQPLQDGPERTAALAAGRQMLEHFRAEACRIPRNAFAPTGRTQERIEAAAHGMLTDRFDANLFRGQPLIDLIHTLTPLFFEPQGLWFGDRALRMGSIFGSALERGFLSVGGHPAILEHEFRTLLDWTLHAAHQQRSLVDQFYFTVARRCSSVDALDDPFQLQQCIDRDVVTGVRLQWHGRPVVWTVQGGER